MVTTFTYTPVHTVFAQNPTVVLPCLSEKIKADDRDIYMAFIFSFRDAPYRRTEIRILTAILR
jgi:hypothetical protein